MQPLFIWQTPYTGWMEALIAVVSGVRLLAANQGHINDIHFLGLLRGVFYLDSSGSGKL